MKVEAMKTVTSSYQSQGSANVTAPSSPVGASSGSSMNKRPTSSSQDTIEVKDSYGSDLTKVRGEGQASNEQIRQAVDTINKNAHNEEAVFGFHEATNRVTIKIVDKDTKEVIKEFPPEKTLDMIAKVWEMAGIMVDERR